MPARSPSRNGSGCSGAARDKSGLRNSTGCRAFLVKQGIPGECLKRPKGQPATGRKPEFGEEDGKLADAILGVAFGDGTATERLIRATVLALGGELPEGPMIDVLAANLGVKPRIIYKATEELRRKR